MFEEIHLVQGYKPTKTYKSELWLMSVKALKNDKFPFIKYAAG